MCAFYVLVAEDESILGRFNLYNLEADYAVLGYRVAQHVAGRGVATATVRELCDRASGEHGLRTLRAATSYQNLASQKVLTKAGFELIEAETGEDGVRLAETERPDLILMDIQLPGLDGYEATRRIKANPDLRAVPLIVVTSYALSGDDVKAFEAGCDAYVTKPFVPRQLLAKIREYLG